MSFEAKRLGKTFPKNWLDSTSDFRVQEFPRDQREKLIEHFSHFIKVKEEQKVREQPK